MPVSNADEPQPPAFPAAYPGDCSECGDEFDQGDMIRADGSGDWCHALCPAPERSGLTRFTDTSLDGMGY